MKKVFIKTYGCQANKSDSEIMASLLKQQGHELVNKEQTAEESIQRTFQERTLPAVLEVLKI